MYSVLVEQSTNTDAPPLSAYPLLPWGGLQSVRVPGFFVVKVPGGYQEALCTFYWDLHEGEFAA